jgi:hypothetical protein
VAQAAKELNIGVTLAYAAARSGDCQFFVLVGVFLVITAKLDAMLGR